MNQFDFGSMPVRGGFVAFYRMVHQSKNFILRDGKHDILFATASEAYTAAGEAFKAYMNTPIVSESLTGPTTKRAAAKSAAEAVFRQGKRIPVETKGRASA